MLLTVRGWMCAVCAVCVCVCVCARVRARAHVCVCVITVKHSWLDNTLSLLLLCAGSFGNMIHPEKRKQARPEDLAKAALVTVTNTVASIANMCAAAAVSTRALSP